MCFKEFLILEGRACYFLYSMYCTVLLIVAKVTFLLLLGELIMVLLLLVPWCFCCWCLLGQCCYMVLWCYGAMVLITLMDVLTMVLLVLPHVGAGNGGTCSQRDIV